MIERKHQPTPTTCGQTCVAMILGRPVAEVVEQMGGAATFAEDLVAYLSHRGWLTPDRSSRLQLGQAILVRERVTAIVRLLPPGRGRRTGHWVLWHQGEWLDPGGRDLDWYRERKWRLTSYLVFDRVEDVAF